MSCLSWVNASLLWTVTPYQVDIVLFVSSEPLPTVNSYTVQVDSVLFVLGEHLPTVNSYTVPGW